MSRRTHLLAARWQIAGCLASCNYTASGHFQRAPHCGQPVHCSNTHMMPASFELWRASSLSCTAPTPTPVGLEVPRAVDTPAQHALDDGQRLAQCLQRERHRRAVQQQLLAGVSWQPALPNHVSLSIFDSTPLMGALRGVAEQGALSSHLSARGTPERRCCLSAPTCKTCPAHGRMTPVHGVISHHQWWANLHLPT